MFKKMCAFGASVLFALAMTACAAPPAAAQIVPVPNTPRLHHADVEIGVWATHVALLGGTTITIAERQPGGSWAGLSPGITVKTDKEIAEVGAAAYLESRVPQINATLAKRFPPAGAPPAPVTGFMVDQLNAILIGSYVLKIGPDGSPILVKK